MTTNDSTRIIIVDDESYVCEMLCRWLTAEGYECVQVSNGEEALKILQHGTFSLVVSDIMMPHMSGMTLLSKVKEQFNDVAVILATAVDDRKMAIKALQMGAYGYVTKPFDQNEVLINVANALERRRLTLASEEYEHNLEQQVRERIADIRQREEEITLRLVTASEYRDEETGSHIRRMGRYAAALAESLGWSRDESANIRLAAPMHDIGKIGTPDGILLKPGKLTDEEFETMKKHSVIGAEILENSNIPLLVMARDIALSHHEKWDGSGYPYGLAGNVIPQSARIVAVADVYDALVTDRIYRPAFSEEKALTMMTEERSGHFDPEVFECFLKLLPEFHRIKQEIDFKVQQDEFKATNFPVRSAA